MPRTKWDRLNQKIIACERCPRLREHCRSVAVEKRRAFRDWDYWGRPVANFGDRQARVLVVGLAPAAHGANRTGRMFTGDRSGDWLYRALYQAGFANQPNAMRRDDGLKLTDCAITAVCHCAPPGNKPARDEIANCAEWFDETIALLPVAVFIALGRLAWQAVLHKARRECWYRDNKPKFAHGATFRFETGAWLVGSYHPSQQNTFTGRLTEEMFDRVFRIARDLLASAR